MSVPVDLKCRASATPTQSLSFHGMIVLVVVVQDDLFREKVATIDIGDFFQVLHMTIPTSSLSSSSSAAPPLSSSLSCFQEYHHGLDYDKGLAFIKNLFMQCPETKTRTVLARVTTALDRKIISEVQPLSTNKPPPKANTTHCCHTHLSLSPPSSSSFIL